MVRSEEAAQMMAALTASRSPMGLKVRVVSLVKLIKVTPTIAKRNRAKKRPSGRASYSKRQPKMAVLKGLLKRGDSIPSVRKMALSLSVTPGTVAKAYGELERQQVIVTIRGKGAYIAETGKIQPSERQKEQGRQKLKEACVEMIYLGFSKKEILKMVEELYDAATS